MKVILNFTIVPVDVGLSLSSYVAEAKKVLEKSGLIFELHANGTNVEGDWDDVMACLKQCQIAVHDKGAKRIFTTIQLGTRTDKEQQMSDKVKSVENKLKRSE